MKKIRSSLVAILLILSAMLVAINFGTTATGPENESDARSPRLTDVEFHWNKIELLSEPIVGLNLNDFGSYDPQIAVEGDRIYVVWEDYTNYNTAGGDSDIFYRMYNGNTWSNIVVISEPNPSGDTNDQASANPDIAVEDGNVYVVWHDFNDTYNAGAGEGDIFFRCNLGSGWEDVQVISEPIFGKNANDEPSADPAIAVEGGNIYVVWHDQNDTNGAGSTNYDIFYRCNLTGSSWEDVQVISEPVVGQDYNIGTSYIPDIAVENNDIFVVWYDYNDTYSSNTDSDIFYKCNITGSNWEAVQVISEPLGGDVNGQPSRDPRIEVDNGNLYVVWEDRTDWDNAGTDSDIFYTCNLTGNYWETIQVISEPVYNTDFNTGDSQEPAIAVENGVLYVTWSDWNNTNGLGTTNADDDIVFMYNSTGNGWSDVFVVGEPVEGDDRNGAIKNDGPAIGVNLAKIHIVWGESNNTYSSNFDYDIHYRNTSVAPSLISSQVTPTAGNTSVIYNYTVIYVDPDNEAPTQIKVKIDGTDHTMKAVNPGDNYYLDGKAYYFATSLGIGSAHTYTFWASDGVYTRTLEPVNLPDVMNTAPNITTPDNTTVKQDEYYGVDYEYDDIDVANVGQTGTWTLGTDAAWLMINDTTGILNGTPTNDDVGDYWVNVTIDDGIDIDWTNYTLTVVQVNDPPTLLPDELPHATEDEFYDQVFTAEDIDLPAQPIFWIIMTNASWLNANITLHKINGTPTNDEVGGEFWVDVTVEDGQAIVNRNFTLIVDNVNDLPMITTEDVTTAIIDELYEVGYEATDDDIIHGDVLTWAVDTNAAWLDINTTSGVLSGTPTVLGSHYVNVSVDDGHGGSDYSNFTLMVEEPPILNLPPEINNTDKTTAKVNESYSVLYEGTDDRTTPENLTWTMETNAPWLSFNETSRELHGVPQDGDEGLYWVNITLMDEDGAIGWTNFTVNVTKPTGPGPSDNNEPELSNGGMSPASGDEDTQFTFSVHYTDEDGDPPTSIKVVIDGVEHDMFLKPGENATDGIYEFKTKLPKGNHTYYFEATDGEAAATSSDDTPTSEADAITTPPIKEGEEKKSKEGENDWMLWVAIIVIILIILAILAFAMMRRKPAARAPGAAPEEEEELEEWEDEEGEEGEDEEWEDEDEEAEGEEGEEGEDEEWEDEDEEAEAEEEEAEEEEAEEEEAEEEEAEEEEAEEEEEWEEEEAGEELPPVQTIDCPKCKADIEVPFSEDAKVGLECPSCGAKGKISNPYME